MKMIYVFDENKIYVGPEIVSDEYQADASRETVIAPPNGLYEPITWGGAKWNGTDEVTYDETHPDTPLTPTTDQQMIMAHATDIAKLKQGVDQA